MAGLMDLRTTHSDGELAPEVLVKLAKERGFQALFINDHDRMAMEYGLLPFRNILRKRVELNSINKGGAKNYLDSIRQAEQKYPDMRIFPGSETAAFYYWTGSYFDKNLTAHNHEKRILTVGLEQAEDYEDLPIIHNGLSLRFAANSIPMVIVFLVSLVIGVVLIRSKGIYRILGIAIAVLSVVSIVNANPFRSSPFDQYHGDQGVAPYQLLIDDVDSRGGMTFWNYPETKSGVREMGPIFVNTAPYPEVLAQSKGYTGFAALYGDHITLTEPGNAWDQVLLEFCKGKRDKAVWGISTADFHKDGQAGERLGNFPTVFLVKENTKQEILSAMRKGRMYACQGKYPQRMILDEFTVCSSRCPTKATMGEEITLKEPPRLRIFLSAKQPSRSQVKIRVIRSGKLVRTFNVSLPARIHYKDEYYTPGEKVYYRFDARGCGTLVSNPIFVTFR